VVEQLERISTRTPAEIHLYCQRVEDLAGVVRYPGSDSSSRILWHRVWSIPGPHLLRYVWWFIANHLHRWWDTRIRGLKFDLLFSPGINAVDADAIAVHIVFREFYIQVRERLRLSGAPLRSWPQLIHRKLYYRLIMALEERVYRRRRTSLAGVSGLVAQQLAKHYQCTDVAVIRNAVDAARFSPSARLALRNSARGHLHLMLNHFVLLLIGNDWKKKGLEMLLQAMAECRELPLMLLVVGTDDRKEYETMAEQSGLGGRVLFLEPSPDVLQFYAAADAYVGPSLEDAFGLPILEAMACGLPVIASNRAGASELIRDCENGLLLQNPGESQELAAALRALCANPELCQKLGQQASLTAKEQTWENNAALTWEFLKKAATRKMDKTSLDG
jgi:glycosyltransferase involved in cell wall biosynthesis